jgi:hypothetical protein
MSKFAKLSKIFGGNFGEKKVTKFDIDIIYKKMIGLHEKININAFYEAILILLKKSFKPDSQISIPLRLEALITRFEKILAFEKNKSKKGGISGVRNNRRAKTSFAKTRTTNTANQNAREGYKNKRKFDLGLNKARDRINRVRSKSRGKKKYSRNLMSNRTGVRGVKNSRLKEENGENHIMGQDEKLPRIKKKKSASRTTGSTTRPYTRI